MDMTIKRAVPVATGVLRQWMQVAVLAIFGGYFTYIIVSGNLANYINERFGWLSYVAASLFYLLAVFSAYRAIRSTPQTAYTFSNAQVITWSVLITAALPLVFGIMIPSQPLGADAVNGSLSTNAVSNSSGTDFTIAPENRNILDWLREFNTSTDHNTMNGQPANVTGFVYREPDYASDTFMIARFTVSCCVADASAIGLPVTNADADTFETGQWVQVTGTVNVDEFNGETLPVVYADAIETVETPDHPYLYP
jgi:putative membrane protein